VVFVQQGGQFRPVSVRVLARNPDAVAVSGIAEGARVALADPTQAKGAAR